jgi:hypothetical protein
VVGLASSIPALCHAVTRAAQSYQIAPERLVDLIRGVQNPPDIAGESIERDDFSPGAPPALADCRVFLPPEALLEGAERGFGSGGINGSVDTLERSRNRLSVFPGDEIEAVAQQMDDASLDRRLWENGGDRLGEALEAVDNRDQDIFDAAVFQLVHDAQSEFGTLVLRRWAAFTRFLDDGRICLTNSAAERALRGIALGRRAWLFAGSDRGGERAAAMYTLIATAKLNGIDPQAWLAELLRRIADHPASRVDELPPWHWKKPADQAVAA